MWVKIIYIFKAKLTDHYKLLSVSVASGVTSNNYKIIIINVAAPLKVCQQ